MCSFINYSRKGNRGSREPDNFTGAALFSGSNQPGQLFTIKCTYCRKCHKSHKGNPITDPRSQKTIFRAESEVLFAYVETTEWTNANQRVNRCKQKHHVSICEQYGRNTRNNSNDLNDANENAENSAQNVSPNSVHVSSAKIVILLQTAEALISPKSNNREVFYLTLERNLLLLTKIFLKNWICQL